MNTPRAFYAYDVNDAGDTLRIIDKNPKASVSVTNDAEAVLTEIRYLEGPYIEKIKVIYRDSQGVWDTMIPTWRDDKCVQVDFKSGV